MNDNGLNMNASTDMTIMKYYTSGLPIDVDIMTSRRAEPVSFDVVAGADYHKDDTGNVLKNLSLTFDLTFPDGPDGDKARDRVASAVQHSHDKSCTVSRTIEANSKVSDHIVASDD